MTEPAPESLLERRSSAVLACMPEGRVAEVVAEPDRFDEVFVQPERAGDPAGDALVSTVCVIRVRK